MLGFELTTLRFDYEIVPVAPYRGFTRVRFALRLLPAMAFNDLQ